MRKMKLNGTAAIVIAMILGIIAGSLFSDFMVSKKFVGDIFLRLIQMSVVILVMGSVIEAVGSLKMKALGRLGGKSLLGFVFTTLVAATVGILLSNLIQPGSGIIYNGELTTTTTATEQTLAEMITGFFPNNIIDSLASGNTIQVIVFAILFGIAIILINEQTGDTKILRFVQSINQVLLKLIKIVMNLAPIGIFSLLGWAIGSYGLAVIIPLFKILLTIIVACLVILSIFILITATYARVSPLRLTKKMLHMGIVALTTASSAITLPVKMEDSENKIGISKEVSRLVNPLGMSLNSDGTALFLAVACITIAQFFGMDLSLQAQFKVVIMATLATIGTIVVPGGGLVALAIVLPTVGLPIEGIALLAGIDWFSGMFRTLLNVTDDVLVALVVAVSEDEFNREIFDADLIKAPDASA